MVHQIKILIEINTINLLLEKYKSIKRTTIESKANAALCKHVELNKFIILTNLLDYYVRVLHLFKLQLMRQSDKR